MGQLILDGALPGTVNICTILISLFDKFTLPSFHSFYSLWLYLASIFIIPDVLFIIFSFHPPM